VEFPDGFMDTSRSDVYLFADGPAESDQERAFAFSEKEGHNEGCRGATGKTSLLDVKSVPDSREVRKTTTASRSHPRQES